MRLLFISLLVLALRVRCEEMVILDGKLVPRSTLIGQPKDEPKKPEKPPSSEIIIHCTG